MFYKLCKYTNLFGNPNKGVHSIRIFNIAVIDVLATILSAFIIYLFINKIINWNVSFWLILIMLFILGIIMHRIFCVRTTIDKLLFKN
jgi:hypothetical protein